MTPTTTAAALGVLPLSSSVQSLETNGDADAQNLDRSEHPLRLQSRAQRRAHAPWQRDRSRIINALWNHGGEPLGRRAVRLARCSQLPAIRQTPDGTPRVDLARCRDRLCPLCGDIRGRQCAGRVEKCTAKADSTRLGTLTLALDGGTLRERTDRLLGAFRRLRSTAEWKRWVRGCVATLEVTLGGSVRHWHVHLHFIWDGDFFPHAVLKRLWHQATGDSFIVHVKPIAGRKAAARYIAAYIGKPMNVRGWTEEEICEYASAMHGRRLLSTSGTFHNPEEDSDSAPDVPPPSQHLVQVHALENAEVRGSEHVRHACDILARLSPNLAITLDRPVCPKNTSLPPIDPREVTYAVNVCQEVEAYFPKIPDPARLERIRRYAFGEPEPDPPRKERQTHIQDRYGW